MIKIAGFAGGDHVDGADVFAGGDGFFAPLAADEIIRAGVEEIHRDQGEEHGGAALEKQDVVGVAQAEELLASGVCFVVDGFKFLAAMTDLGDAKSLALVIDESGRGFLQDFGWQHCRTCAEIENSVRHICTSLKK